MLPFKSFFLLLFVLTSASFILSCNRPSESPQEYESAKSESDYERLLDEFAQAWNRHDLDALMSMMTNDCVFEASGGNSVNGQRYEGQENVRQSFASVFERFPDAHWGNAKHLVEGDRGFSEWTFTGTLSNEIQVEVNGCDLFTLRDGKIAVKNSFRKKQIYQISINFRYCQTTYCVN